jgi:hypothetical protein
MKTDTDEILLGKINRAVAGLVVEELEVCKAHDRLESKWKEVGELLIEAKRHHPQVKAFDAFLKRVSGLHRSRAYELMKIAGGGTTEEEVREVTRLRVRKHRAAKQKAPKVSYTPPCNGIRQEQGRLLAATTRIRTESGGYRLRRDQYRAAQSRYGSPR